MFMLMISNLKTIQNLTYHIVYTRNEYSAFYALSRFMDLVVNEWNKYSQLAYIRKTLEWLLFYC